MRRREVRRGQFREKLHWWWRVVMWETGSEAEAVEVEGEEEEGEEEGKGLGLEDEEVGKRLSLGKEVVEGVGSLVLWEIGIAHEVEGVEEGEGEGVVLREGRRIMEERGWGGGGSTGVKARAVVGGGGGIWILSDFSTVRNS